MRRTVFVVGAGASSEFLLPVGSELVVTIRSKLTEELAGGPSNQPIISSAMSAPLPGDFGEASRDFGGAARDIAGGMIAARSIDRFLETRKDRPLVNLIGKRAIAWSIADGERRSTLSDVDRLRWETVQVGLLKSKDTWIAELFRYLIEGVRPDQAERAAKNISFITFNYDRVIEWYLRLGFQQMLQLQPNVADAIVEKIPLVHVYGSLGGIGVPDEIPYASDFEDNKFLLQKSAATIRTFTEQHDSSTLSMARELIDRAEFIVFLGFAFDRLNVEALFPQPMRTGQLAAGTIQGIDPMARASLDEKIIPNLEGNTFFQDTVCRFFLADYRFREMLNG